MEPETRWTDDYRQGQLRAFAGEERGFAPLSFFCSLARKRGHGYAAGMKKTCFAWMAMALLLALPVVADDTVTKLETYLRSPDVASKVYLLLVGDEARITPTCTDVEPASASRVSVFGEIAFDAAGKAVGGLWTARYPVKVCNKAVIRSVAFASRADGNLEITPMVPGESLADPLLQLDTKQAFAVSIQKMIGECSAIVVRDTQVVDPPVKLRDKWREAWIAHACGRDAGQVIEFVPNKEGTAVKMGLAGATDGVSYTVKR